MSVRSRTLYRLASHNGRVANFGDGDEGGGKKFVPPHKRDVGAPSRRKIPTNHPFDPKALKPLVKMLWATSVALGHTLTAHRQFSRLKSVSFSPDGLVGGQGYVLSVKDVRSKLYEASELLSTICDSIYDEVNGPHWKPKLAELDKGDKSDVFKLLDDATDYMEDPEGEVEEDMEEVEDGPEPEHVPAAFAPKRMKNVEDPSDGSRIPGGGRDAESQGAQPARFDRPEMTKQSSSYTYSRRANSSLPVTTLSGPRVEHLDRGDQPGPLGSWNREESLPTDEWGRNEGVGNDYDYPSEWENDASGKSAASHVPDSNTDPTATDGFDFGIGRGDGDEAKGGGAGGYGESNPSTGNKGVYGPRSGLPWDPGGKTHDSENSDSNPAIENATSGRSLPVTATAKLPLDVMPPVARSDYYAGPKGNDLDIVTGELAESEMPGDGMGGAYDYYRSPGPGLGYKYERPDVPYRKIDYTTKQLRPDWMNQRDPLQGPYKK